MTESELRYKRLPTGWYKSFNIAITEGMKCRQFGSTLSMEVTKTSNRYVYCGDLKFKRRSLWFYGIGLKEQGMEDSKKYALSQGYENLTISKGCQLHGDQDYELWKNGRIVKTIPYNY